MLSTGTLVVRLRSGVPATAIRVTSADAIASDWDLPSQSDAIAAAPSPPSTISLYQLLSELRAKGATSTTAPTTTTSKPVTRTTAAQPTTTAPGADMGIRPPPAPTTTTTPLTPLTTILTQVAPAAAAVLSPMRSDTGQASWFNAPDGTCAHRDLPMGTIIKVTRTSNGSSTTCKVNDRGPTLATGRIIDLSLDTFEKLAAREAGVVSVRIEW